MSPRHHRNGGTAGKLVIPRGLAGRCGPRRRPKRCQGCPSSRAEGALNSPVLPSHSPVLCQTCTATVSNGQQKRRNFFYNLIEFFRFAAARRRDSKSDYISAVSRAPCFHRCCLHGPIACEWECCKGSLYNPMRERVQPMVCQPDFVRFKPRDQPETGLHKKPGAMRARFFCLSLI